MRSGGVEVPGVGVHGVGVHGVVMHCQRSNREHMESRFLQAHLLPYKHCPEGFSCAVVRRHEAAGGSGR